jgi:branched-chain amino acid transport system substrate-binding protein
MKTGFARTALGLALLLGAATFAHAQDKAVKIGVLTDMSGLYSDISGAGSVAAA